MHGIGQQERQSRNRQCTAGVVFTDTRSALAATDGVTGERELVVKLSSTWRL